MSKKKTTEEFIAEARAVHGDKYNYDKVVYRSALKEVIITCPLHGEFPQRANSHLDGCGCKECAKELRTKTTEEFIAEAKVVHGNKYIYDKTKYINPITPIIITCLHHGDFQMFPYNHLQGHGCKECMKVKMSKERIKTTKEFIIDAKAVHGDRYNYDKVIYNGAFNEVTITCPKHGDFQQQPHSHLMGCGCKECHSSLMEEQVRIFLNKNNITFEPQKTFSWLRNKREMPLDFFLPDYNTAIECQGEQHYLTKERGYYTKEKLYNIKQRDELKYTLCQEHGIQIHYIRYDEDINENIDKFIKSLQQNMVHTTY